MGIIENKTDNKSSSIQNLVLHPAKFGAYTELYAGLAPELSDASQSGAYVIPWGRLGEYRDDVAKEIAAAKEGKGNAVRFVDWCEQVSKPFAGAANGAA